mgnify:CR=1 FL=1
MLELTFGEQVKIVLNRKDMTIKQLAEMIEERTGKKMSRQNLTQRLARDNFQEQDMRLIASILECPFHLSILEENADSEYTTRENIKIDKRAENNIIIDEEPQQLTLNLEYDEPEQVQEEQPVKAREFGISGAERDITIGELVDIHKDLEQMEETSEYADQTEYEEPADVKIFDGFRTMPEAELKELYDSLNLAMTFKDFQHIQHYFKEEEKRDPSMTEIRVLDTYWSDHCRHTTFSTELTDVKFDEGDYKAPIVDTYKKYLADREVLYKGRDDKFVCLMDLALMAMKKLKAWMAEHKKFSVIALCLLLMFTCGSAMSAINVSHHRAETAKEQNAGNNTDTTTAAEKKTKEETGKVELTDAQKEIIKGYDTDTKELIDTLSSSVWSVSEGRYTLKFADDSYVETVNGTPTVHSYAISRVEKTSDGYGGYLYTIVFETDTGTHIVTYTDGSGAAVNSDSKTPGENTISTLTSSTMFAQKNTAYERAEAVANITVKGMNSEVTKLFGGDEKAVTTALSKWCAVHYPSVTEATWQKVVNLDYENGVITTDFKLNDTNSVSITCVYEQSTGEFSFEG